MSVVDGNGNPTGGAQIVTNRNGNDTLVFTGNDDPRGGSFPRRLSTDLFLNQTPPSPGWALTASGNQQRSLAGDPTAGVLFGSGVDEGYTESVAQTAREALDIQFATVAPPSSFAGSATTGGSLAAATYFYSIRANLSGNCGAVQDSAPAITAGVVVGGGNNAVSLTWTPVAGSSPTLKYCIQRQTASANFFNNPSGFTVSAPASSYTDTGSNPTPWTTGQTSYTNPMATSYRWLPGAGFIGLFTQANTANRTYTLPDVTGTLMAASSPTACTFPAYPTDALIRILTDQGTGSASQCPVWGVPGTYADTQSGVTSYTIPPTDYQTLLKFQSEASAIAATLPAQVNFYSFASVNEAVGTVTYTPASGQIWFNGALVSTITETTGQAHLWYSDNTNWTVFLIPAPFPASANVIASNAGGNPIAATGHNISLPLECSAASGSGTTYTCTTSPSFTPADGDAILFEADVANTGAATLNVDSSSAAPIKKQGGGTALVANDMLAGQDALLIFDGTNWQMQGQVGNAPSGGANTALSNLASVSINNSLLAQTGVDLGSTAAPFRNLYLFGSGTYGTDSFELTGTSTANRVQTLQDITDTFVYRTSTDTLTNKSLSLDQLTGAAAQHTITETAALHQLTFAGVETANLTFPYVFTNTNSTNNNNSGAVLISTIGSSSTAVPLFVNESTAAGNLIVLSTGGTVTNGVLSGQTNQFTVSAAGVVGTYKGTVTAGQGVPPIIGSTALSAQTAAISATTICTPPASGFFRISVYAIVTTAATTSSALGAGTTSGLVITYTEPNNSVAQSVTMPMWNGAGTANVPATGQTGNTTTTLLEGSQVLEAKSAVPIQYAFGYTSAGGTPMAYALRGTCEQLQ